MEKEESLTIPVFSHVEPVLPVRDIAETISYWQKVLGFEQRWTWGDPPNHAGISWQTIFIQFSLSSNWESAPKGQYLWIAVKNLEILYARHQQNKAEIVSPLENKPWGMSEYVVREINGHYLCFSESINHKGKSAGSLPETIRILSRVPTIQEYRLLTASVGWGSSDNDDVVERILAAAVFGVVAEDSVSGDIIGCALLLGDEISFYYVKDVIVRKDWQKQRVGTALMQALTNWLEKNAPDNAYIGLFTGDGLAPFYQQFGFSRAFGMHRRIRRDEPM